MPRILKDYGYIKDIKIDLTAQTIIHETVPILTGASFEDIIEFREENKDSLEAFRIEMGRLTTEIESNFWEPDFHKSVLDIVDSKIIPSLHELKTSAESTKEKLGRIFKKGVEISPLPIVASVAPGCIPEPAIALSAGVLALGEILEYQKRKRLRKKNGFAYLFDLQRKSNRFS